MKVGTPRTWRPLRFLLVFLCLGGVVIAAETDWMTSLRVGHVKLTDWFSHLTFTEPITADTAVANTPAQPPVEQFNMKRWIDSYLFAAPSTGWTLESKKRWNANSKPLMLL